MTLDLALALAGLDDVDLDELNRTAALLVRHDRKYALTNSQVHAVLADLPHDTRVLAIDGSRQLSYGSVYFDTPTLACFLDTAHRRPRRAKVRTRHYLDSGDRWLEVKERDQRGATHKWRRPHRALDALDTDDLDWVATHTSHVDTTALAPTLTTSYRRTTLLLPDESRATIDVGLRCTSLPDDQTVAPGDLVLVETKSAGRPTTLDRLLWAHGHRSERVSKYATGLAAVHPELPHNAWHRLLTRHFGPATADQAT